MASLDDVFPGYTEDYKQKNLKENQHNICPQCSKQAIIFCNCDLGDRSCDQGHKWYIVDDKIVLGSAHDNDNQK